ncbi:cyclic nucleotide-binding domain-containing protein [Corallococcus aberystwythensis]|uniref:Cyclic nucleotide-binding protein n=1 Tax=Corallococcus aberystwythensis TaxID=2316722 RepID=A0A3A8QLH0_9BACT|nr:cyclic nucleotide-binding domain-containing protein [Corallococcus aberystwythensis]RKH69586.1 cyclic nucleotide-binding protein [Corallococcus aberystwythensis]
MELRELKDKATEAFSKGRFARAAELYADCCQADPKDHQSRLRMGDAWVKAGQRDRAVSAYQSAAEGFAKEGFLPRAIAASKLILELDPSHQGVQQMLADLYARKGTPAASRAKPKDAAPPSTPASLIAPREAPPAPASPSTPAADDTEVVISVEVELEPSDAPAESPSAAPPVMPATEAAAESPIPTPPATPAPQGQSVRGAPPSPSSTPEPSQPRTPSGRWQALAPPITGSKLAPAPTEQKAPVQAAPPGLRPRRADTPSKATAATPAAGASVVPTTAGAPEPWRASLRVSSFTELEIEADSLLHAVELAAQRGLAEHSPEEEPVYELTEEAAPEAGTWDALPSIPLFSDLPREAFIQLFERCPLRRFGPGERILAQGTHGDAFYVICEGSVRVFREEDGRRQDLATLEVGAFFGEMALLSGAPRAASVESLSDDTQVLEISAAVLATLSRSHPPVANALKKFCRERLLTNVMNSSALFRPFNRKDRRNLVERFRARDVERGDVIIREDGPTDGLYVVLSGEVEVHKNGQRLSSLREGDLFGEISLLQKTPATATVEATRHTTLLRLPREDFDSLISSHPQVLMLVSDLSDERMRRTQHVLDTQSGSAADDDEDLILV